MAFIKYVLILLLSIFVFQSTIYAQRGPFPFPGDGRGPPNFNGTNPFPIPGDGRGPPNFNGTNPFPFPGNFNGTNPFPFPFPSSLPANNASNPVPARGGNQGRGGGQGRQGGPRRGGPSPWSPYI